VAKFDKRVYEKESFGTVGIKDSKDLPTLKLRYLMQLLAKRKHKRAKLLEVGSGSGRILASIRERDPFLDLTGIDISKEQCKLAQKVSKERGTKITFVCGDGERLPFADNSFDYVIFFDFLEHIEHPQQALGEICRVLKKGGYIYAVTPAENHGIYKLSKKVFRRHFKEEVVGHIQMYSKGRIEELVRGAKLTITDETYSYHLFGSIMDYTMFTMLLNKRMNKLFWKENKYWATDKSRKPSLGGRIFNALTSTGNAIAYLESSVLKNTRFTATAVHITAQKR
jgi:ubiquinone/menaquinone biosynthesis C-methylase UbiE